MTYCGKEAQVFYRSVSVGRYSITVVYSFYIQTTGSFAWQAKVSKVLTPHEARRK